jgi:hypothetical protein
VSDLQEQVPITSAWLGDDATNKPANDRQTSAKRRAEII